MDEVTFCVSSLSSFIYLYVYVFAVFCGLFIFFLRVSGRDTSGRDTTIPVRSDENPSLGENSVRKISPIDLPRDHVQRARVSKNTPVGGDASIRHGARVHFHAASARNGRQARRYQRSDMRNHVREGEKGGGAGDGGKERGGREGRREREAGRTIG